MDPEKLLKVPSTKLPLCLLLFVTLLSAGVLTLAALNVLSDYVGSE